MFLDSIRQFLENWAECVSSSASEQHQLAPVVALGSQCHYAEAAASYVLLVESAKIVHYAAPVWVIFKFVIVFPD